MADMMDGVVPADGGSDSSSPGSSLPGKLSFLNAEWVNERVQHVAVKVEALLDRIIDQGLTADGFLPFESPITDEMLARMSPGQFRVLFDSVTSLEGKADLLERMKALKLPLPIQLPFAAQTPNATRLLSFDQQSMRVDPDLASSV